MNWNELKRKYITPIDAEIENVKWTLSLLEVSEQNPNSVMVLKDVLEMVSRIQETLDKMNREMKNLS